MHVDQNTRHDNRTTGIDALSCDRTRVRGAALLQPLPRTEVMPWFDRRCNGSPADPRLDPLERVQAAFEGVNPEGQHIHARLHDQCACMHGLEGGGSVCGQQYARMR